MNQLASLCAAVGLALTLSSSPARADGPAVVGQVADVLKRSFAEPSSEVALDTELFENLRLYDPSTRAFRLPELEAIKTTLLARWRPNDFIDRAAACAQKNDYLLAFLARAETAQAATPFRFTQLRADVRGPVLQKAVAFAVGLDRLTKAMRDDHRVLKAWRRHVAALPAEAMRADTNAAGKLAPIHDVLDTALGFFDRSDAPADGLRARLPKLILDAMSVDALLGQTQNARAAWPLWKNPIGSTTADAATTAGPTRFSADRKSVVALAPFPKQWADLYTVWSLAFDSQGARWPFAFARLLTPQVGCYWNNADSPGDPAGGEFLYNRTIALGLHLQSRAMARAGDTLPAEAWNDPAFTTLFGEVNLASATAYQSKIKTAKCAAGGACAVPAIPDSLDETLAQLRDEPIGSAPIDPSSDPVKQCPVATKHASDSEIASFYQCAERTLRCGPDGYLLGYGARYAERFMQHTFARVSPAGQEFLRQNLVCLQETLRSLISARTPCPEVHTLAFNSHPQCYVSSGFCSLSYWDWGLIGGTVTPRDLFSADTVRQVRSVAASCLLGL